MTISISVLVLTPRSTIPREEQGNLAAEALVHSKKHILKSAKCSESQEPVNRMCLEQKTFSFGDSVRVSKDPVSGMRPGFKISALLLTSCVALNTFLDLGEAPFLHLSCGDSKSTYYLF